MNSLFEIDKDVDRSKERERMWKLSVKERERNRTRETKRGIQNSNTLFTNNNFCQERNVEIPREYIEHKGFRIQMKKNILPEKNELVFHILKSLIQSGLCKIIKRIKGIENHTYTK